MKQKIMMGVLRAILASLGGACVTSGYMDESTATEVIGAVMVIVTAVWSTLDKMRAKQTAAPAAPAAG